MVKSYITKNPSQTRKLGEILAKRILRINLKKAIVIGLIGELGSGKTTFLQGFAKGLGIKQRILSPTFVLIRRYEVQSTKKRRNLQNFRLHASYFFHIDCYRIQNPKEILALGLKKIISRPENIVAIEWADKIKKNLPKNAFFLDFKFIDKSRRQIVVKWQKKNV